MEHTVIQTGAKKTSIENVDSVPSDCGYEGLINQHLVNEAKAVGIAAAQKAMKTMGYVLTEQDGWIVKKYADGRMERITSITN